MSYEKLARESLVASFEAYKKWQQGHGDERTFLDWVSDELGGVKSLYCAPIDERGQR